MLSRKHSKKYLSARRCVLLKCFEWSSRKALYQIQSIYWIDLLEAVYYIIVSIALMEFLYFIIKDTAGKYRELAAKKCHHIPKPTVELQKPCILAECPVRTTPSVHQWRMHHQNYPALPPPQPEWHSSPWSQVNLQDCKADLYHSDLYQQSFCCGSKFLKKKEEGLNVPHKEIHITHHHLPVTLHSLQCTVTCGGGVRARTVQCLAQGKPSPGCALHLKPAVSQACNTNFCPQPEKKGTGALIECSPNKVL